MIYLDNAATTFPKPAAVIEEVQHCLTDYCGNPGRGAHQLSLAAAEKIYACREAISNLFAVGAPERVIFTAGATHSLNQLLKGFLRPGNHILLSELEHNAVRRPLHTLSVHADVSYDTFPVIGLSTAQILSGISKKITPDTVALICTHSSNICSVTLPIFEIGMLCREKGLRFFVDAAQTAGRLPINMQKMNIDALAIPGHKSLYGIQGCGFLALSKNMSLTPLLEGGSGMDSLSPDMPRNAPERYEAGTLPVPAIAALSAGIEFVKQIGLKNIAKAEEALYLLARERLKSIPNIILYAADSVGPTLLFNRRGIPSTDTAQRLGKAGLCVRAGLHCAPLAHHALSTPDSGAVRVSFGFFNTPAEVETLYRALK